MKIKYKGINIEITEEKEEPLYVGREYKERLMSLWEKEFKIPPPIDLSRNCKCSIDDQFKRILDKLNEEVLQTVDEFTRRRKIEEKSNSYMIPKTYDYEESN